MVLRPFYSARRSQRLSSIVPILGSISKLRGEREMGRWGDGEMGRIFHSTLNT
ncbi:MAG: hypothetical protein KME17_00980 [Cyanosarcina radialis HA8281-LM2]|nr:hypothetical protein [Cyanosarcina radialis HA8281-LM2]